MNISGEHKLLPEQNMYSTNSPFLEFGLAQIEQKVIIFFTFLSHKLAMWMTIYFLIYFLGGFMAIWLFACRG
jgi:hypothetical protein